MEDLIIGLALLIGVTITWGLIYCCYVATFPEEEQDIITDKKPDICSMGCHDCKISNSTYIRKESDEDLI